MLYNTRSLLKIALRTIYSRVCLARQSDMSPKLDGSVACISPARRIFCVRSFIPTMNGVSFTKVIDSRVCGANIEL